MPLPEPEKATYTCKHFKWEKWTHYGCAMLECGCRLSKDMFACKYRDGKFCPNYEAREEAQNHDV